MKKILVVEDDEGVSLLLKEELADEGYYVERAANGKEAMDACEKLQPDLITLDLKMPVMDGLEFLDAYRMKNSETPIVICTAYPEFKQNFKVWASDAYIVKSGDTTQLKKAIKGLLSRTT
jgi:CheY-like chemotaxis protein